MGLDAGFPLIVRNGSHYIAVFGHIIIDGSHFIADAAFLQFLDTSVSGVISSLYSKLSCWLMLNKTFAVVSLVSSSSTGLATGGSMADGAAGFDGIGAGSC